MQADFPCLFSGQFWPGLRGHCQQENVYRKNLQEVNRFVTAQDSQVLPFIRQHFHGNYWAFFPTLRVNRPSLSSGIIQPKLLEHRTATQGQDQADKHPLVLKQHLLHLMVPSSHSNAGLASSTRNKSNLRHPNRMLKTKKIISKL